MRELYIHIGCTKTGSSFLQGWLAQRSEELRHDCDIQYTVFKRKANDVKIGSGNGGPLFELIKMASKSRDNSERERERAVLEGYFCGAPRAVVSREGFSLLRVPEIKLLQEMLDRYAIQARILVYARSVYDHCWSSYHQQVKRHGCVDEFSAYATQYRSAQVAAIKQWAKVFGSDRLMVVNYDALRSNILGVFCEWLSLKESQFKAASDDRIVNRSLSRNELLVLTQVNSIAKSYGIELRNIASDFLIYKHPNIRSWYHYDAEVEAGLVERCGKAVEEVNANFVVRGGDLTCQASKKNSSASDDLRTVDNIQLEVIEALIGAIKKQQLRLQAP